MNLDDRVRSFLANWPIVEKRLNEILEEVLRDNERLLHGERACRSLQGESENDLPEALGEGDPGL